MRLFLLALLVACNGGSVPARNLVCERVATINPKATCVAEMSDVGEQHTHTARVTVERSSEPSKPAEPATVVCALNAGQISMVCGELEQAVQKPDSAQPGAEHR